MDFFLVNQDNLFTGDVGLVAENNFGQSMRDSCRARMFCLNLKSLNQPWGLVDGEVSDFSWQYSAAMQTSFQMLSQVSSLLYILFGKLSCSGLCNFLSWIPGTLNFALTAELQCS